MTVGDSWQWEQLAMAVKAGDNKTEEQNPGLWQWQQWGVRCWIHLGHNVHWKEP